MKDFSTINDRVSYLIELKADSNQKKFAEIIGFAPQVISNIIKGRKTKPSFDVLLAITSSFDDISSEWLLTGDGEMFKSDNSIKTFIPDEFPKQMGKLYRAPIYNALPVSAGNMSLSTYEGEEPTGYAYTVMPGVKFFPVVGCSFEPLIPAGSYIGVIQIDNWSSWKRVDPEKIFLIITHEDRMMKRIRIDKEDSNKIWCTSPNFEEFDIWKEDIVEMQHVFFYGKMV